MSLRTLYQTLLDSDIVRLRVIARQWKISLTADRRLDVGAELADAMAHNDTVERVLTLLQEDERAALNDLLRRGSIMPWSIFTRRWGKIRLVGPGRLEREELWREPISAAESLWYLGLVQRTFEARPVGQVEMAFVPEELQLYIPEPAPLEIVSPEPVAPPVHHTIGDDALADDLVTVLAAQHIASLTPTLPDAHPETATQMAPSAIGLPADVRIALLETLALEQGWLRKDEDDALRPVPEPMLAWLQADSWTQWTSLVQAWMQSTGWNDLATVPALYPDPVQGWPDVSPTARAAILELLHHCQPGRWYALHDFVAFAREYATDFLRPDGDYDTWALRRTDGETPLRGFKAWDAVEGALVAHFLTGPLLWLGMVDVGRDAPAQPASTFRVNTVGTAILGRSEPPDLPEPRPLRLHDTGVVHVPARQRYTRFQLRRIAQPEGWADGYRYRLTPSSLALARQQRISLRRIVAFLQEMASHPMPAHLRTAIEAAYQGQDAARLERVWLLRVADPAVLEHQSIQPFIQEQLESSAALIREADREKVLAILARSGILPDVSSL